MNLTWISKKAFSFAALSTVILSALIFESSKPASAVATRGKIKFSMKIYKDCIGKKPPSKSKIIFCEALAIAADPSPEGITNINMSISYDPSKWTFKPKKSGFLCDFSLSGDCPSPEPLPGNTSIEDIPDIDYNPGSPLPNSTFSLINDNINGLVTLNYELNEPLDSGEDQNFFSFYFEPTGSKPISISSITSYNEPGNYDFTQLNSSCLATINGETTSCGSNNPTEGFDIEPVPEPFTILGTATALGIGSVFKRKYSKKKAKSKTP